MTEGLAGDRHPPDVLQRVPADGRRARTQKIAQPPAIGPDDVLDTGPDAYDAQWSPDSQNVAVGFRTDRHMGALRLYQIRNRRPQIIRGPDLRSSLIHAAHKRLEQSVT